jgi:hypothetical protein
MAATCARPARRINDDFIRWTLPNSRSSLNQRKFRLVHFASKATELLRGSENDLMDLQQNTKPHGWAASYIGGVTMPSVHNRANKIQSIKTGKP